MDAKYSTQLSNPLAHAVDSDSNRMRRGSRGSSFSQINHLNADVPHAPGEAYGRGRASRMLVDVSQRFLHYPKQCNFFLARQPSEITWNVNRDPDLGSLRKLLAIPLNGRWQPHLVQHRRVQQVRKLSNLAKQVIDHSSALRNQLRFAGACSEIRLSQHA